MEFVMKWLRRSLCVVAVALPLSALAEPPTQQGLPPGLEKKVERGEPLPPGWQKKIHVGDHLDYRYLDYGRVYDISPHRQRVHIEDRVYTIIKETREIVDILENGH
jgi:hypothetical protein